MGGANLVVSGDIPSSCRMCIINHNTSAIHYEGRNGHRQSLYDTMETGKGTYLLTSRHDFQADFSKTQLGFSF